MNVHDAPHSSELRRCSSETTKRTKDTKAIALVLFVIFVSVVLQSVQRTLHLHPARAPF
jgi:hypothetical protein